MEPDAFAFATLNLSYPVYSLYLDSPDLRLYRAALDGECDRFKLRFRYYGDLNQPQIFAEIKRRNNNIILKNRVAMNPEAARAVARGQLSFDHESRLLENPDTQILDEFVRLVSLLNARPTARVVYEREAWVGTGTHADIRVTLDRKVRSEPARELDFHTRVVRSPPVFGDIVILELKFRDRYPLWFHAMVRTFGLKNQGAAKYVTGIEHNADEFRRFLHAS